MANKDNRSVGTPGTNQAFMGARPIPVQHDKPRINDQRKVSQHAAGDPAMGVRPSGGKMTNPKEPRLNTEYMQLRDVPMKSIHESELTEWNPLSSFFNSRTPAAGDSIGYQINKGGINIYHLKDGKVVDRSQHDSYESLSSRIQQAQGEANNLKWMRRAMSINPRKVASILASDFARQKGLRPSKIFEIPPHLDLAMPEPTAAAEPEAEPTPAATTGPENPGSFSGVSARKSGSIPRPVPNGSPARNQRDFWNKRTGGKASAMPAAEPTAPLRPSAASPEAPAATHAPAPNPEGRGRYEDLGSSAPGPAEWKNLLSKVGYDEKTLNAMSPYQLERAFMKIRTGGESPRMRKQRRAPMPMAAESAIREGWRHQAQVEEQDRIPVKHVIAQIREMGMKCRWDRDTGEFRVNYPAGGESSAYYTTWAEDAIGTARHMKEQMDAQNAKVAQHTERRLGMHEGYPDTSFERDEPAHESHIGNLSHEVVPHDPSAPDLNKDFAEYLDLRIQKVHEQADREISAMLDRTLKRFGVEPMSENMGHDPMGQGPEVDEVTLPSYWASALVNGDFSGLDSQEAHRCRNAIKRLAQDGWEVVDTARDDEGEGHDARFTWHYRMHDPEAEHGVEGGDVLDYVIHRRRQTQQAQQAQQAQPQGPSLGNRSINREYNRGMGEGAVVRERRRWV